MLIILWLSFSHQGAHKQYCWMNLQANLILNETNVCRNEFSFKYNLFGWKIPKTVYFVSVYVSVAFLKSLSIDVHIIMKLTLLLLNLKWFTTQVKIIIFETINLIWIMYFSSVLQNHAIFFSKQTTFAKCFVESKFQRW